MVRGALTLCALVGCAVPQVLGAGAEDAPAVVPDGAPRDGGELERYWVALAAGSQRSCAVSEGSVFCWGDLSAWGFEGVGSVAARPTAVPGVLGAEVVALGDDHGCALARGGLWCWGSLPRVTLDGGIIGGGTVMRVAGVEGAHALSCGPHTVCVKIAEGWTCRGALEGLVAQGPRGAEGFHGAATLAVGREHVCGLWATAEGRGRVRCVRVDARTENMWLTAAAPEEVLDERGGVAQDVTLLAAAADRTCFVRGRTRLQCLGRGAFDAPLTGPVEQLSVGLLHGCVTTAAGEVRCWGNNTAGQAGTGGPDCSGSCSNEIVPVAFGDGFRAAEVRAGVDHTCARSGDGRSLRCWGDNHLRQLGTEASLEARGPKAVLAP